MYIHSLVGEEKRNSIFFFRVKTVPLTKLILHLIVFKPHVTMQSQHQAGFFYFILIAVYQALSKSLCLNFLQLEQITDRIFPHGQRCTQISCLSIAS